MRSLRAVTGIVAGSLLGLLAPVLAEVGADSGNHVRPPRDGTWVATDLRHAARADAMSSAGRYHVSAWSREVTVTTAEGRRRTVAGRVRLVFVPQRGPERVWSGAPETFVTDGRHGTGRLTAILARGKERCDVTVVWRATAADPKERVDANGHASRSWAVTTMSGSCLRHSVDPGTGETYSAVERTDSTGMPGTRPGFVDTFAGIGEFGTTGDGGPARWAAFASPTDLAIARDGRIAVAEVGRIRLISRNGRVSTLARGIEPASIVFAPDGTLVASGHAGLHRIDTRRRVTAIRTSKRITTPGAVALDGSGGLYVVDHTRQQILRVDRRGVVTVFAGRGPCDELADEPVEGPATSVPLCGVADILVARDGVYITEPHAGAIRRIANGRVTTLLAAGTAPYWGLAAAANGTLFVSDIRGRVLRLDSRGVAVPIAGAVQSPTNDIACYCDDVPALAASLDGPAGIAVDPAGTILIAEQNRHVVRMIAAPPATP